MREIIIGKGGNQPFKIVADGVSHKHARLTITEDGQWIIEDLRSTNGTYIYNLILHRFEKIDKKVITPNTLIRLGSDNTMLCFQFKAGLLIETGEDKYFRTEFRNLMDKWDEVQRKRITLEKRISLIAYVPMIISWLLAITRWASWSVELRLNVMCVGMMITPFLSKMINELGKKWTKTLNNEIKETFICPNPNCSMPLSDVELKRGQCFKCKKHI